MKTIKFTVQSLLLVLLFLPVQQTEAQRKRSTNHRAEVTHYHRKNNRYRTQPVYRNPYYRYPARRHVVRTLHRNHLRLVYGGLSYFYYAGVYYTVYGDGYIAVVPPTGMRIAVLPVGYTRIVVGPQVYFYHSGVYYTETQSDDSETSYEITKPPVGAVITEIPEDAEEVVIDEDTLYIHNDIFYKKVILETGETAYKVVYYSANSNS